MNPEHSAVVELRQYTLHPGQRDVLIELFEREFIESQQAAGMALIGQSRDLDDANRFVWLRGFPDMVSRAKSLAAFYDGPVWRTHRKEANATMIDSDNVLLLRPAAPGAGFAPQAGGGEVGLVAATIYPLAGPRFDEIIDWFTSSLQSQLIAIGAVPLASLITEPSENTFPRLPVREGEHVFVSLVAVPDDAAMQRLQALPLPPAQLLAGAPQRLRLAPTARSWLR